MLKDHAKLNDMELNEVTGGTVGEFDELVSAFANNPALKQIAGKLTHVPGANKVTVEFVEHVLYEMGIEAKIDLGFLGTGLGSKANTYKSVATGQTLTHGQVIQRIRNSVKDYAF